LPSHAAKTRLPHVTSIPPWAHTARRRHPCSATGARHMRMSGSLNLLSSIDLSHSAHSSTPQSRILIAISPTVHSSLNKSSLSTKTWIQFCQSPTNCVALGLIDQAITSVLILCAACTRINTVFSFEFGAQRVHVDRLNVTSNGVFHLNAIA
jgi:hypothetical protein